MNLITIFETQNPAEAEVVRATLEAAGIQAFVPDEHTALAPMGVRVQVGAADEIAARDVIASSAESE